MWLSGLGRMGGVRGRASVEIRAELCVVNSIRVLSEPGRRTAAWDDFRRMGRDRQGRHGLGLNVFEQERGKSLTFKRIRCIERTSTRVQVELGLAQAQRICDHSLPA